MFMSGKVMKESVEISKHLNKCLFSEYPTTKPIKMWCSSVHTSQKSQGKDQSKF